MMNLATQILSGHREILNGKVIKDDMILDWLTATWNLASEEEVGKDVLEFCMVGRRINRSRIVD